MSDFQLQFGDETLAVDGSFPEVGTYLPSFMLVDEHLNDLALEHFRAEHKVLITLISVDEEEHGGLRLLRTLRRHLEQWPTLKVLAVSVDSPFALHRARREHGMPGTVLLSTLRGRDFHLHYGVLIKDYPFAGFTAPALILADKNDVVLYAERLKDTREEFDWTALQLAIHGLLNAPQPLMQTPVR